MKQIDLIVKQINKRKVEEWKFQASLSDKKLNIPDEVEELTEEEEEKIQDYAKKRMEELFNG